jgi:hypothetical protein
MRCICGALSALTMAILLQGDVRAIATALSVKDIDRALKLAQAPEQKRAQFHAAYVVRVNDPVVEQIEVVTEFRRSVLTAEEQLRLGNWLFAHSVRDAQEKLRPWRDRVSLVARLRFHPHNMLAGIPPYDIRIDDPELAPLTTVRTPITALLSGKPGDFNVPLMGATIEAVFDVRSIGQTARPVRVALAAQAVAGVTIDFARLE